MTLWFVNRPLVLGDCSVDASLAPQSGEHWTMGPGSGAWPRFKPLAPAALGPAAMATGWGRVLVAWSGVNLLVAGTDAEHEISSQRRKQTKRMAEFMWHTRTYIW